jgi:hypothetical protein
MSLQLKLRTAVLIYLAFQTISPGRDYARSQTWYVSSRQDSQQTKSSQVTPPPNKDKGEPQCEITTTKEITISCNYSSSIRTESERKNVARIVLNHVEVSFEPHNESYMLVELEFTNEGQSSMISTPAVYLAIDNDKGRNVVRRSLPHVNLANLHAGERATFSERFLVGAFPGGNYTISLSIPDPEPSRRNIPAYNMLLDSTGVPDPATGLNTVAHFGVTRSMHSSRHDK